MSDVIKNALYWQRRTFKKSFSKVKTWHCKSIAERIHEQKLESSLIKSLLEKLINSVGLWKWTSPNLIMPSLFNSVASRGLGISTCVKGRVSVTHWKHWFLVKLALITVTATSTTGGDSSAICTSRVLFLCEILSYFGVIVKRLGERFILQGKAATLFRWGWLSFYC